MKLKSGKFRLILNCFKCKSCHRLRFKSQMSSCVLVVIGDEPASLYDVSSLFQFIPHQDLLPRPLDHVELGFSRKAIKSPCLFQPESLSSRLGAFGDSVGLAFGSKSVDRLLAFPETVFLGIGDLIPLRRICAVDAVRQVGLLRRFKLTLSYELAGFLQSSPLCDPAHRSRRYAQISCNIFVLGVLEMLVKPGQLLVRKDYRSEFILWWIHGGLLFVSVLVVLIPEASAGICRSVDHIVRGDDVLRTAVTSHLPSRVAPVVRSCILQECEAADLLSRKVPEITRMFHAKRFNCCQCHVI